MYCTIFSGGVSTYCNTEQTAATSVADAAAQGASSALTSATIAAHQAQHL
jgi:hypothetical protein